MTTIHELVQRQVEERPDDVALRSRHEALSYAELQHRSGRLVAGLALAAEARVGICAERTPQTVVAMLAVLRAGAACLPLDPTYPADRLAFMVEDSGCDLVVADAQHRSLLPAAVPTLVLDDLGASGATSSRQPLRPTGVVHPDQVAMVLYTSGSTGRPKGAMITHRNVAALVRGHAALRHRPGDLVAHVLSSSFDAVLLDVWGALVAGATVFLPPHAAARSGGHLLDELDGVPITTLPVTSSLFHQLVQLRPEVVGQIPRVWFGGEPADPAIVGQLPETRLVHHYGPTECTSISTVHLVTGADAGSPLLPIGLPLDTVELHLVDEGLEPVPVGAVGEMLIGGPQVARGYLDRPRLTAEHFVPDPFGPVGARLYRTGDLARQLPNGELRFVGRRDEQVKIRGYRVEPAEVASALRALPGVVDAVVVARDDLPGERQLVAYVVGERTTDELRSALAQQLPEFMVPSVYVPLDVIPLLPNHKVAHAALPVPDAHRAGPGGDAGHEASAVEAQLAELWCDILDVASVGPTDDFFMLGGYSLLAARLAVRIEETFAVTVPLRALFDARRLCDLAGVIEEAIEKATRTPEAPEATAPVARQPSAGQRELWFLDRLTPNSSAYNSPLAFRMRGTLDVDALQRALDEIVRRHEVLRWSFRTVGGRPEIAVAPEAHVPLQRAELPGDGPAPVLRWAAAFREQPFDLAAGPLLRAALIRTAPADLALIVSVHHIVFDGGSFDVFVRELGALYAAHSAGRPSPLPELPRQYGDLVADDQRRLESGGLDSQIAYWRRQLDGAPPAIELPQPGDEPGEGTGDDRAVAAECVLPVDVTDALRAVARDGGSTPFMLLLAALAVTLHAVAATEDVVVASPNAGRRAPGTPDLIGLFVRMLPLRLRFARPDTLGELRSAASDAAVGAFDNQDVPFERIVQELRPPRSRKVRAPYAQIVFNMVNLPMPILRIPGLDVEPIELETPEARVPLAIIVNETGSTLAFHVLADARRVAPGLAAAIAQMLPLATELVVQRPDLTVAGAAAALGTGSEGPVVDIRGAGA